MRDYCVSIKFCSLFFFLITVGFLLSSCGSSDTSQENSNTGSFNKQPQTASGSNITPLTQSGSNSAAGPSPATIIAPDTQPAPDIKYYNSKGIITKINMEIGSVELNHEDIPGLMPAMNMEFYVKSKQMLTPLKVGDQVAFKIEEVDNSEVIIEIKKQ